MERQYTIGFANVTEKLSFAVEVRKSVEAAAAKYGNIHLIVRNNEMDNTKAQANIEEFAQMSVDLGIISHIDERVGPSLAAALRSKMIPVMSVEVPIPLTTFFGINNKRAGQLAGELLGDWINTHWQGHVDKILVMVDYRYTGAIKMRMEMAVKGLLARIPLGEDDIFYLHSGNIRETAHQNALPVLTRWGTDTRIGVLGMNDDTALGAIDAAQALGSVDHLVAVGQGATLCFDEFRKPGSRLIGSTAYHPENYGEPILDLALRILRGEHVPRDNFIEPTTVTPENTGF